MAVRDDVAVLRGLAKEYAAVAADPRMEELRKLWRDHLSLRKTPVPIIAGFGMWNVWCREVFSDDRMSCQDPFFRSYERVLRMQLFHASYGDDWIFEPWITVYGVQNRGWDNIWGVRAGHGDRPVEGGSWKFDPVIKDWADVSQLSPPPHWIDEAATRANAQRLGDAIGDILAINVDRSPCTLSFSGDIAYWVTQLRGLEQLMMDMYESPEELHRLLGFMRDGILANHAAAESAGDWAATGQHNQCMTYADTTVVPSPNRKGIRRKQIWGFMAAQEYELISPAMHDEFLLQYQLPIMEHFGLVAYGCCENLTQKIDMLRKVPNLRIIAVTPRADFRRCAEQIGGDYVSSWRPNPTDMICAGFDESRIRRILREGVAAFRGGIMHINLKDIETLEGDLTRLPRWVKIAREEVSRG